MTTRSAFLGAAATAAAALAVPARLAAQQTTPLRVISFPSPSLLPVYAAIEHGFYARENLAVSITYTRGSVEQFQRFGAGEFEIMTTAMDNIIAYDAGQGEAQLATPPDFAAILGCDNGMLRFYGRPEIASVADLRGKTLGVDALSTGYAFVLRAMLAAGGVGPDAYTLLPLGNTPARYRALLDGRVAATIISAPGDHDADVAGMKRLGDVYATIGPYQGSIVAVRRAWLRDNGALAATFARATRAAARWCFDAANRDAATQLLVTRGNMAPEVATTMIGLMLAPGGLSPTLTVDAEGVRNVLALRAKYAVPAKPLGTLRDYVATV